MRRGRLLLGLYRHSNKQSESLRCGVKYGMTRSFFVRRLRVKPAMTCLSQRLVCIFWALAWVSVALFKTIKKHGFNTVFFCARFLGGLGFEWWQGDAPNGYCVWRVVAVRFELALSWR